MGGSHIDTLGWRAATAKLFDFGRQRQWLSAVRLLRGMQRRHVQTGIFTCNVSATISREGHSWPWALHLLAEARTQLLHLDAASYSAAAAACGLGRRWAASLQLCEDACLHRVATDVVFCTALISACARGGRWQIGLQLFADATTNAIVPDTICFNAAISACEKGMAWIEALWMLSRSQVHNVRLDTVSYNTCLSCLALLGEERQAQGWATGVQLLQHMKRMAVSPDAFSYAAVVSACERGLRWRQALWMATELRHYALYAQAICFIAAISAGARCGAWAPLTSYIQATSRSVRKQLISRRRARSVVGRTKSGSVASGLEEMCFYGGLLRRYTLPNVQESLHLHRQVITPVSHSLRRLSSQTGKLIKSRSGYIDDTILKRVFLLGRDFVRDVWEQVSCDIQYARHVGVRTEVMEAPLVGKGGSDRGTHCSWARGQALLLAGKVPVDIAGTGIKHVVACAEFHLGLSSSCGNRVVTGYRVASAGDAGGRDGIWRLAPFG